jgi:hypothetical protein
MTDPLDRLQNELDAMRPQRMPAALVDRIMTDLSPPARRCWSDRLLIGAISAGSIAAAVIVCVLVLESRTNSGAPAAMSAATIMQQRGGSALAFARTDADWP